MITVRFICNYNFTRHRLLHFVRLPSPSPEGTVLCQTPLLSLPREYCTLFFVRPPLHPQSVLYSLSDPLPLPKGYCTLSDPLPLPKGYCTLFHTHSPSLEGTILFVRSPSPPQKVLHFVRPPSPSPEGTVLFCQTPFPLCTMVCSHGWQTKHKYMTCPASEQLFDIFLKHARGVSLIMMFQ